MPKGGDGDREKKKEKEKGRCQMKKVLAALLVLAVVAPAMAVTITGSDLGDGKLRLTYDVPTGEVLRGVALKLSNTDGAAIAGTAAVTAIDSFFDVFIDYAFDNSEGFTVTPRVGHPLADPAAAGVLDVFPASTFSLSMGVLDETGNQGGVEGSGVLCEIQFALANDSTIVIEADTLRGGAVVGDAVTQPTIAPVLLDKVDFCVVTVNSLTKTTAAPAIADRVNAGRTETFVAAATSSLGHALEYQFTWGDGVVGPWGAATQTHVYTYTAATTYNVSVAARCTIDGATDAIDAPLVCTSEAVKSSATAVYATWATFGRPNCWAFRRNCRGDVNGLGTGLGTNKVWVNATDLGIFAAGYNKTQTVLLTVVSGGFPGICADNDRAGTGLGGNKVWVNATDLGIFALYYNKTELNVPICVQTNYHYWTN